MRYAEALALAMVSVRPSLASAAIARKSGLSRVPSSTAADGPGAGQFRGAVRVRKDVTFKEFRPALQIAYSEVYVPGELDSQGELMRKEDVAALAHEFMRRGLNGHVDFSHDNRVGRAAVVESFVNDETIASPKFAADAWVAGTHFPDPKIWEAVRRGDFGGYSFEADVVKTPIRVRIPFANETVEGVTLKVDDADHVHTFRVRLNDLGNVVGGETDVVDGHSHRVIGNTKTEIADGHRHYFHIDNRVELLGRAA